MGTASAGELCDADTPHRNDAAFLERVASGAILWYRRFRDDGLFAAPAATAGDQLHELEVDFAARGSDLKLELTRNAGRTTHWLDLELTPHTELAPRLHLRTHFKQTHAGFYLTASSYHPKSTLHGWAEAELRRYARNSTDLADCLSCARRLERCLAARLYTGWQLDLCGRAEVLWQNRDALYQQRGLGTPNLRLSAPLVLRYHEAWQQLGVSSLLARTQAALDAAFEPQAAP